MKSPRVAVIILNWNNVSDTLACLKSVNKSTYSNYVVLVVDNGSSDGSLEIISTKYPNIKSVKLYSNKGYTGGNNTGIRWAIENGADWILLLNNDTKIAPDCLTQLILTGNTSERIGIVGPIIYHYDEPEVIQSAGGCLNPNWVPAHIAQNEFDLGQITSPRFVDWISGCALFIRRDVIDQVGLLDERFFCYWEEVEWCLRVRRSAWKIAQTPKAKIWHKGVQKEYQPNPYVTYYMTRNRLLLLKIHQAPFRAWVAVALVKVRTLISWSIKPRWRSKKDHRNAMWLGVVDFVRQRWGPMVT
jgi:GT2 family glycosyltransferase